MRDPRFFGIDQASNNLRVRRVVSETVDVPDVATGRGALRVGDPASAIRATLRGIYTGTFTPAGSGTVAANGSAVVTVTVTGVAVGDMIFAQPEGAMAGPVSFSAAWVSAANTVSILYQNADFATARASSTPPAFRYIWFDLT